mmetsp:Transcript_23391/g.23013  ORF Transcript_23391/g.23013 Transcript_23391/m.23013 type:complete len:270 (-) Transcript_23391:140-949(-)
MYNVDSLLGFFCGVPIFCWHYRASRCALIICDYGYLGGADSLHGSVPLAGALLDKCLPDRERPVHHRCVGGGLVLLPHLRLQGQGLYLHRHKMDPHLPHGVDCAGELHHCGGVADPAAVRVLPEKDPDGQQGQQAGEVPLVRHQLLPLLPREVRQVHHQERLHPSGDHQQVLLPLRLEWLPPHHQKRSQIRHHPLRRLHFHVRRQTLHRLQHRPRQLRHPGDLGLCRRSDIHSLWASFRCGGHCLCGRGCIYECLLLCLRCHPPVLPLR